MPEGDDSKVMTLRNKNSDPDYKIETAFYFYRPPVLINMIAIALSVFCANKDAAKGMILHPCWPVTFVHTTRFRRACAGNGDRAAFAESVAS